MTELKNLSSNHSGYQLDVKHWERFFDCWKTNYINFEELPFGELIKFSGNSEKVTPTLKSVVENEKNLPHSFLDFHCGYARRGGCYRNVDINDGIGFFEINEIQTFSSYNPSLVQLRNEYAVYAKDKEYYKYGVDQDFDCSRTSYYGDALVVAQYSFERSELMLLYPNSRTSDGEMEVAILGKAWEFRAPSFAEMMRQLSIYCLSEQDSLPPYKQALLQSSCADCLPLTNVWWK